MVGLKTRCEQSDSAEPRDDGRECDLRHADGGGGDANHGDSDEGQH
jgi:hypothetical protein